MSNNQLAIPRMIRLSVTCSIFAILLLFSFLFAGRRAFAQNPPLFSFTPQSIILPAPDPGTGNYMVNLNLNAGTNAIVFARSELKFDPSLFRLSGEIQPSSRFMIMDVSTMAEANASGNIVLTAIDWPDDNLPTPTGNFVLMSFNLTPVTALSNQSTELRVVNRDSATSYSQVVTVDNNELTNTFNNLTLTINPRLLGDFDEDDDVDYDDWHSFIPTFDSSSQIYDLSGNGRVDVYDYNILIKNYGATSN